ncbi:complex I subunit 5 family protein [Rehaibacterium terrae]|jgi:multicomponent Na+:H+ antiporter subunit D|uniref:Formate hydrogenlyase subunit 3/multisubunit Na+/H+ antiporter MnhD subunit n=1 Tax=Rehaibacterium terrae TaxID=1341696 RepID=A0A7W7V8S1_9GAMM|nr:proton-conducting transporter membrane subunit [Rehaibacterium terrae]MBB5014386.1 formate hydrogenlyase subunit 3/multisubunit Na+/H+ antiporter MnhD subunit [Rehaibacterium terrae]
MAADALLAPVFLPLAGAIVAVLMPARGGRVAALVVALLVPLALWPLSRLVSETGGAGVAVAGLAAPLGIELYADGLSLLLLWLVALVMLAATAHAAVGPGSERASRAFWPAWMILYAGLNAVLVSADLFNLYVSLELLTLAAVALVASRGETGALRGAMRYLLVAMLASLVYLLGVALVYAATGTLDLRLAGLRLGEGGVATAALALMTLGLLLKSAIFPLHGWLPPAHASAPGPVSAVLSGLVVKASLYLLYRLWFEMRPLPPASAGTLLAVLGLCAVLYGSLLALAQRRLKQLVAYSTVAQLGYAMLVFALPVAAAWQGTVLHLLSHGLAKAAMFLAAANLILRHGGDHFGHLPGSDARMPVSVFAFGLAGVSLMGLPPSGGFLVKWQLLVAAWEHQAWPWVVTLLLGSLFAAAYLFRVLALMFSQPRPDRPAPSGVKPSVVAEYAALVLALLAIAMGFASAPVLAVLRVPLGMGP